ncbi:glycosyltransferase [Alsobacter soli]|uniref:glycosyltransferase n=1 Tax=Alsobacter soli TaxID=2109933 RepID=UPI001FDEB5CA|nr:glycosyltransferase [Alsobacter soli]
MDKAVHQQQAVRDASSGLLLAHGPVLARPNRLRVCLFTDSRDPSGVGEHMLTLAASLRGSCQVSVVARRTPGGRRILKRASELGCRVFALEWWDRPGAWWSLVRFLKEESVEVFHTHAGAGWEGLPAPYASREAGTPVTLRTEHLPYILAEPRHRLWHAELLPHLHGLVCVSEDSRESYVREGVPPGLVHVIPNGVAPASPVRTRTDMRKRLGLPGDAPVILTVARLAPQKGHAVLLQAAQEILAGRPDARFLWAGSGPLAGELRDRIAEAGLCDAVRLLGHRRDIPDLMAAADLFVLPSLFEGHPLVALEAMQAGLPVVATDAQGTREAVQDGVTGLLAPPSDPSGLARAVAAALADPSAAAARARAARTVWAERFSAARMAADHLALYRAAIASARPQESQSQE